MTDPAGKVRRNHTDALGRLVEVKEDPSGLNYTTKYRYGALDNLEGVCQGGTFDGNGTCQMDRAAISPTIPWGGC